MVVRSGEGARGIREPVEQVGPPQRAIDDRELGRRFAAAMRLVRHLPDLDAGTVLGGRIVKVDLEPVPDGDGRAGKSQDVLHGAPVGWVWTVRLSMRLDKWRGQRGRPRRAAG